PAPGQPGRPAAPSAPGARPGRGRALETVCKGPMPASAKRTPASTSIRGDVPRRTGDQARPVFPRGRPGVLDRRLALARGRDLPPPHGRRARPGHEAPPGRCLDLAAPARLRVPAVTALGAGPRPVAEFASSASGGAWVPA